MIRICYILIGLAVIGASFSYAQDQHVIDSLKARLKMDIHDTNRINILNDITRPLIYTNTDTAKLLVVQSLSIAKKIKWPLGIGESAANLGAIYWLRGKYDKALELFSLSLENLTKAGDKKGVAATLSNIGVVYWNRGNFPQALYHYNRALAINKELGNLRSIAINLGNIGGVYMSKGDHPRALDCYLQGLQIQTERKSQKGIAFNLGNIGIVYFEQAEYEKALEYYNKSLKINKELDDKRGMATCINNMGIVYKESGDYLKALEYQFKAEDIYVELGSKSGLANTYVNLGNIYSLHGNKTKGLAYYFKSLELNKELGRKSNVARSLGNIGNLYSSLGNYKEAEKYLNKGLAMAKRVGSPKGLRVLYKHFTDLYEKSERPVKALEAYKLYIIYRDSISNEENTKAQTRTEMKYEYEKQHLADSLQTSKELDLKDIEISKQKAEAKAERTTKYGLYGGLCLVLLIAFVLYRSVQQKKKANDEIIVQKQEVEHKNKEILDSITYAERIQSAILPPMTLMKEKLGNSFVLYKPKDIVAGDFYWLEIVGDDVYYSAADCTGHGVPGAMMSVMCSTALTKCVKELGLPKPGEILDATTKIIEGRFERSEQLVLDGMDLAVCKLNVKSMQLEYAGANNPLWIIHEGELLEMKADKQPIGMYDDRKPYTNHKINLEKGDSIYIFSDGFEDQFGGPKGKKFKRNPFKKLLLSMQDQQMDKQKELIDQALISWQGTREQVDDICIIGVKV